MINQTKWTPTFMCNGWRWHDCRWRYRTVAANGWWKRCWFSGPRMPQITLIVRVIRSCFSQLSGRTVRKWLVFFGDITAVVAVLFLPVTLTASMVSPFHLPLLPTTITVSITIPVQEAVTMSLLALGIKSWSFRCRLLCTPVIKCPPEPGSTAMAVIFLFLLMVKRNAVVVFT